MNPFKMELEILYEDNGILIVNKPPFMPVHPSMDHYEDSLSNGVKFYFNKIGLKRKIRPVNRLDKNTSGIVIAAKNAEALRQMNEIIRLREIDKKYLLAAEGVADFNGDILKAYLRKDEKNKKAIISKTAKEGFKEIKTQFTVIKTKDNSSLIEANLLTGRFHQIRAHMSHLGFPLMGDTKYGGKKNKDFKYQALYSYKLKFNIKRDCILTYLDGKEFTLKDIWFEKYFD